MVVFIQKHEHIWDIAKLMHVHTHTLSVFLCLSVVPRCFIWQLIPSEVPLCIHPRSPQHRHPVNAHSQGEAGGRWPQRTHTHTHTDFSIQTKTHSPKSNRKIHHHVGGKKAEFMVLFYNLHILKMFDMSTVTARRLQHIQDICSWNSVSTVRWGIRMADFACQWNKR